MNGWRVGVSSIGVPLGDVVARAASGDAADAALGGWLTLRRLDFLLVMASHGGGDAFRRELGMTAAPGAATALLPRLVRPALRSASQFVCVCVTIALVCVSAPLRRRPRCPRRR
jgi:hypothetical protein